MGAEYISNALSTMIDQSSIKNIYSTSYCNSNYRNLYMRSKINSHDLIKVQDDFRINIGHSNFYEIKRGFFLFFNNHELFENTVISIELDFPYIIIKIFRKGNSELNYYENNNAMFYHITCDTRKSNLSRKMRPITSFNFKNAESNDAFSHLNREKVGDLNVKNCNYSTESEKNNIQKIKNDFLKKEKNIILQQKLLAEKELNVENNLKKLNEINIQLFSEKITELQNQLSSLIKKKDVSVAKSKKHIVEKIRRSSRLKKN